MVLNLKQTFKNSNILVIGLGGIGISVSMGLILKKKKFDIYEKNITKINMLKKINISKFKFHFKYEKIKRK